MRTDSAATRSEHTVEDLIEALTVAADIADYLGAVDTHLELHALIADAEDNRAH